MCGKKLNNLLKGCGNGFARHVVCLLFLLLVASPLFSADWAFLKSQSKAEEKLLEPAQEVVVEKEQVQVQVVDTQTLPLQEPMKQLLTVSENLKKSNLDKLMSQAQNLEMELNNSKIVSKNLKEDFKNLVNSVEIYKQISVEKDVIADKAVKAIGELEAQNIKQADDIVALGEALKNANKSKGYVRVTTFLGFEDLVPKWGVGTTFGVRLGHSLMLDLGANYELGSFTNIPALSFDLNKLTVNAGLGWEF